MWGGSFGSSRNSGAGAPGRRIPATIFRLLSSSATYVVPFSMTGLLSPVALFLPGTIHDYAIRQAGPSILSRRRAPLDYSPLLAPEIGGAAGPARRRRRSRHARRSRWRAARFQGTSDGRAHFRAAVASSKSE